MHKFPLHKYRHKYEIKKKEKFITSKPQFKRYRLIADSHHIDRRHAYAK